MFNCTECPKIVPELHVFIDGGVYGNYKEFFYLKFLKKAIFFQRVCKNVLTQMIHRIKHKNYCKLDYKIKIDGIYILVKSNL